ncbi:hypothetical protein VNO80_20687 [Phaseolus coccineus]|uniref:Uncharacterized protein n=1 Tax=Phaseolus coccineus TaxID=3886 RepID=A0AAN9QSD2_PHACN
MLRTHVKDPSFSVALHHHEHVDPTVFYALEHRFRCKKTKSKFLILVSRFLAEIPTTLLIANHRFVVLASYLASELQIWKAKSKEKK